MKNEDFEINAMRRLTDEICSGAGIGRDQAGRALSIVMRLLASRLPSPIMGRIREALSDNERELQH